MALRRHAKPDASLLVKSVEDMRRELQDTLERLDESIKVSRQTVKNNTAEVAGWEIRAKEAEDCMEKTDDPSAQEAFQMLHVQAVGYISKHRQQAEIEAKLLGQRVVQAEELRQATNRLEVENIKANLRREIASNESIVFSLQETAGFSGKTVTEENEREIQRLILNAEALLEIKA